MTKYQKDIKQIISKNFITKDEIFDFTGLETEEFYLKYYNQLSSLLQENSKKNSLTSTYLFIENKKLSNAGAISKNHIRYIKISNAFILSLHNKLIVENKIFQHQNILHLYEKLNSEINLSELMLQSSLNFTFYHEFRHLLQHSEREFSFEEKEKKDKEFDFNRHLYEYDSDMFGAWYVMDNAFTVYEKLPASSKTPENLSKLFYVSIASIIIVFLLFYYDKIDEKLVEGEIEEFYTTKNTHPHTLIRIYYIIEHFNQNVEVNYLKLDIGDVLKYSFEIANIFFNEDSFVYEYLKTFEEKLDHINCYLKILDDGFFSNEIIQKTIEKYKSVL